MILVTGAAGFIGFHTCKKLLDMGEQVIGVDNLNDYYSVELKNKRLLILNENSNFEFHKISIENFEELEKVSKGVKKIIHLAAQAGVRYSLENPRQYIESNIIGHFNILEICKNQNIEKLVYASSSSVYGMSDKFPLSITDKVDSPVSLYAATKKSDEVISESYNSLYKIPMVGLRFFTVYGEYGRPDMAPYKFTEKIKNGKVIDVYNNGEMWRDFTYVGDIVDGVIGALNFDVGNKHRIYNLGNDNPVELKYFISLIEKELGKKASINYMPMQKGDVLKTAADIKESRQDLNYSPKVSIEEGVKKVVAWHLGQ